MKRIVILVTLICSFASFSVNAQIIDPKKETERQGTNRVNKRIGQGIDKGFDKLEDGIGSFFKKKKKRKKRSKEVQEAKVSQCASQGESSGAVEQEKTPGVSVEWSRFDFVPGDEVIFEDGPQMKEESGEFPSRWDLNSGNCEVVVLNGQNVIGFPQGGAIIPYMEKAKDDYLPEIFTVEFDVFYRPKYARRCYCYLYDKKNQKSKGNSNIVLNINSVSVGNSSGKYPGKQKGNWSENGGWRHISVAFTKGKLKAYLDDTRLINIPRYQPNPSGITIEVEGYSADAPQDLQYIKNVRIAKGGVKYYDRVMTDGKIICNGIRFDVNKATLKPQSIGPINKIYKLMQNNADLRFSVEGHTDSDGDQSKNLMLSEKRAKAVVDKLVKMGIASGRLTSKGFGETMPIDDNNTPESKANNRRVEFVRINE